MCLALHRRLPHGPGAPAVRRLPSHARRDRRLGRADRRAKREVLATHDRRARPRGATSDRHREETSAMKQHHFLLRLHLAVRVPRLRAAAGGARGPELRGRLPAGAVRRPAQAPWGQLGPAEIGPSATGPTGRCCGSAQRTASRCRCRRRIRSIRSRCCAWRWPAPRRRRAEPLRLREPCSAMSGAAAPMRTIRRASPRLTARLAPARDPNGDDGQGGAARRRPPAAVARGVFGVPTLRASTAALFWGLDALPMLAACLRGDPWFDGPGVGRRRGDAGRGRAAHSRA